MYFIIGLGNPGKKYEKTRHNIGFQVVEELKKEKGFPEFKLNKKSKALICEGFLDKERVIVAKPVTFMNLSGSSAEIISGNYNIEKRDVIVIHDDIDLPVGKIKISHGRGSGGHKGVESIIKSLGTENFIRLRIGIQPRTGKPKNVEKFVLRKFDKDEEKILKDIFEKIIEAIEMTIKEGLEKAMNIYNCTD